METYGVGDGGEVVRGCKWRFDFVSFLSRAWGWSLFSYFLLHYKCTNRKEINRFRVVYVLIVKGVGNVCRFLYWFVCGVRFILNTSVRVTFVYK